MNERFDGKPKWRPMGIGNRHQAQVKEIDPEILAKMPVLKRTIVNEGLFEFVVIEVKKLLRGEPNELFP